MVITLVFRKFMIFDQDRNKKWNRLLCIDSSPKKENRKKHQLKFIPNGKLATELLNLIIKAYCMRNFFFRHYCCCFDMLKDLLHDTHNSIYNVYMLHCCLICLYMCCIKTEHKRKIKTLFFI